MNSFTTLVGNHFSWLRRYAPETRPNIAQRSPAPNSDDPSRRTSAEKMYLSSQSKSLLTNMPMPRTDCFDEPTPRFCTSAPEFCRPGNGMLLPVLLKTDASCCSYR